MAKVSETAPKILPIEGLAILGTGVVVAVVLSPEFWHFLYSIIMGIATLAVVFFVGICGLALLFTSLRLDKPIRRMPPQRRRLPLRLQMRC